jgi:hypothetical protein
MEYKIRLLEIWFTVAHVGSERPGGDDFHRLVIEVGPVGLQNVGIADLAVFPNEPP